MIRMVTDMGGHRMKGNSRVILVDYVSFGLCKSRKNGDNNFPHFSISISADPVINEPDSPLPVVRAVWCLISKYRICFHSSVFEHSDLNIQRLLTGRYPSMTKKSHENVS